MVAVAFIGNLVIGVLNAIIQAVWIIFVDPFLGIIEFVLNATNGGFNSFGDGVANLIGQIISWFLSLGKVVTTIIDAIFGTDWTSGLSSLQDNVLAWGKNENAITLDRNAPLIDHRFEYDAAWDLGYDFGQGVDKKIGGIFDGEGFNLDTYDQMGDITTGVQGIDSNTGSIKDSIDISEEDLKNTCEKIVDTINEQTNGQVKADALLQLYNKRTRNLKIRSAFGDSRVRAGTSPVVMLDLGDMQIQNYMLVEQAKHTFQAHHHSMDITLRGGEFIA